MLWDGKMAWLGLFAVWSVRSSIDRLIMSLDTTTHHTGFPFLLPRRGLHGPRRDHIDLI